MASNVVPFAPLSVIPNAIDTLSGDSRTFEPDSVALTWRSRFSPNAVFAFATSVSCTVSGRCGSGMAVSLAHAATNKDKNATLFSIESPEFTLELLPGLQTPHLQVL